MVDATTPLVSEADSYPFTSPEHDREVARIAAEVRARAQAGESAFIQKGGVHHVVPLPGDKRFAGRRIDVSALRNILHIDPAARVAVVEPGVTFAELARATLAHGLTPTVVPELEGITCGGAVAGCSVEAMSFRYGGFHDSAIEYEVVSGTGEVMTLSRSHEPHLFHMIHGSYGTLGVLTRLTIRLVPARPFVKMEYQKCESAAAWLAAARARIAAGDVDFIDGIAHSPTEWILCLGRFAPSAPRTSNYRGVDIFYKSTRVLQEDWLTTEDYFFRYDTECHWLTRTVPPLQWKPVRALFGRWLLGSTNLIKWSNRLAPVLAAQRRPDVVVDVFIPSRNFLDFATWYERDFQFWPLWLVPYRIEDPYPWIAKSHAATLADDLFIDCAVYGKKNNDPAVDWSQVLEEKTYALNGIKTLISRNHHTRDRFWQIYDRPTYEQAKQRLDPHGIWPDLYDKFHRNR